MAKMNKVEGTAGLRAAERNGRALAMACIGVLKPRLGNKWNNEWRAAGFTDGSLAVSGNPLTMLQQLAAYFAANPTQEVPNLTPTIAATASACNTAARAITTAATASNQSNTNAGAAKKLLETGIGNARSRLSGLRDELTQLLEDDDERWYAFGFSKPSDPDTPEVPLHVVITGGSAGMVFVDWDDAPRAERYRVTLSDATSGAQVAEEIVEESEHTFTGLTSGKSIKAIVTSRNDTGGESGPSDAASGVVP